MITSVFNKSKPLNFTILFILLLLALLLSLFKFNAASLETSQTWEIILVFIVSYFSALIVNFIVYKNNLSNKSNYELLIYGIFVLALPSTISNLKIVCSNFFVLMALRKMVSMKSLKFVSKKLFDAGCLIAIATLLNSWLILFLPLAMASGFLHYNYQVRNILAPLLGVVSIVIILISTSIIITDTYTGLLNLDYTVSYTYTSYIPYTVSLILLVIVAVWSIFFNTTQLQHTIKSERPKFKIILYAALIGVLIPIISSQKTGAEFLYAIGPLAILLTKYIDRIEEKWLKETLLWVLLVVPLLSFLF